jgi:hypothetical protein
MTICQGTRSLARKKSRSKSKDEVSSRPERTRISCHAALDKAACAPFCKGKAHEVRQRHQVPQEIRGSEVEGPAVPCIHKPIFAENAALPFVTPKLSVGPCSPLSHYLMLIESATVPFVIPTGAKRSGGICSSADHSWKCFSTQAYPDFLRRRDDILLWKRALAFPTNLSFRPERSGVERSAFCFSLLTASNQKPPTSAPGAACRPRRAA